LTVVRNKGFSDSLRRANQLLDHFQRNLDDLRVSCVESGFNWDDQLRNDRQHFGSSLLEHVANSLYREEPVRVNFLPNSFEEDGQVVVVVQLSYGYLPVDLVLNTVLHCDGHVSPIVETTEFTGHRPSGSLSTSHRSGRNQF